MKRKITLEENDDGTFRYEYNKMFTDQDDNLKREAVICYPRVVVETITNFTYPGITSYIIKEALPSGEDNQTLYTITYPCKEGAIYV